MKTEESYDPLNTMLALNAAIMSVHKVTSTADRIVLDQEYREILTNFAYGNVADDDELINVYDEILDILTREQLQKGDRERFQKAYERQISRSVFESLSGIRAYGGNLLSMLGSFLVSAGSAYFNYESQKVSYRQDFDSQMWELDKERILYLNQLQATLLRSSWRLLRTYKLPDRYRLTEETIVKFLDAIRDEDLPRALRKFERLVADFEAYPPFWFYYGRTAQRTENKELARRCYETFEKTWRPVLRKDPFRAEEAKNKILLLNDNEQQEALRCVEAVTKNSRDEDWTNFLFAGLQCFLLGKKEEALHQIQINIDNGHDAARHAKILSAMKSGKIDASVFSEVPVKKFEEKTLLSASDEALDEIRKSAETGDTESQFLLGWKYFAGSGSLNDSLALQWFQKASSAGHPVAKVLLGRMFCRGRNVEKDLPRGEELIRGGLPATAQRAEKGDSIAQFALAAVLDGGYGTKENTAKAFVWYRKAAEQGNAVAQNNLGYMYEEGRGVLQDDVQAVSWYRKAAEQGHSWGQLNLGSMYSRGRGVLHDDAQAIAWFRKGAEQGNAVAQNNLGAMFAQGQGVPKDDVQAVSWYRKGAEQGDAIAQNNLGWMYERGRGVPKDDAQAVSWYRKAAEQEYPTAQTNLGNMYLNGQGVPQEDVQAVSWYRKAAAQGDASAQRSLGYVYSKGRGVTKDDVQAVTWYRKAAEQGETMAQFLLGWMYDEGQGIPQDDVQAVTWYRKAADQGSAAAQNNLGLMYLRGRGVSKDDAQAVTWFRKAAEQREVMAQRNLGYMYEEGRGVQKNLREAYRWFYIAHSNGYSGATEKLKELTTKGWVSDAPISAEDAEKIRREADDWMRQKGWK